MTGGGSGGHITPVLAVASALKAQQPDCHIVYIGQRGEPLLQLAIDHPAIDAVHTVSAGKFRRYHGMGWRQIVNVRTQLLNIRDFGRFIAGTVQSYFLLRRLRPAVIFTRGGFVSVPVALAAGVRHIPYVTHDSDSVPSLANRLIAKRATKHLVALPVESYPYPTAKTVMTGIPLSSEYQPVTDDLKQTYRRQVTIEPAVPMLLVTGGGNGAKQLNQAVALEAPALFAQYPTLVIVHFAGQLHEADTARAYDQSVPSQLRSRVRVLSFASDFYAYSGAADVIVARAGATNLAEFAVQGKACIIVPADHLVGGHQTKNARALAADGAIEVLTQPNAEEPGRLSQAIGELLDNNDKRHQLETTIATLGRPDAARQIATELLAI